MELDSKLRAQVPEMMALDVTFSHRGTSAPLRAGYVREDAVKDPTGGFNLYFRRVHGNANWAKHESVSGPAPLKEFGDCSLWTQSDL